ncbi:MAG: hypothetical protein FWC73_12060 [Defluviitaleaceae bacterium]|nr:hypothetical protein [Defluviitaleaceae bacterium]
MDNKNVNLQDEQAVQQCGKCIEYAANEQVYGVFILAMTFIGPIIGMLIGFFVGKKLLDTDSKLKPV